MSDICLAIKKIESFNQHNDLRKIISEFEKNLPKRNASDLYQMLEMGAIDTSLFTSALEVKQVIGQINVMIHAWGVLVSLPHILKHGEEIEYVSLGAGNTGKQFDLKTSYRVAEFKFITWRGGPETIRKNSLFKDFYNLVANGEDFEKYLYVLETDYPLKSLNSTRTIKSTLSKRSLYEEFTKKYGDKYKTVKDYYKDFENSVKIVDLRKFVPELSSH